MSDHDDDDAFAGISPLAERRARPSADPMAGLGPDEDPELWARIAKCAEQTLNDTGNGQRFRIHFGENLIWVPRVGWYDWSGQVWVKDPDMLVVRGKAQTLGPLIEKEVRFISVPPDRAELVERRAEIEADIARLKRIPPSKRTPEQEAELSDLQPQLDEIMHVLSGVQDRIGQRLRHAKNAGNSAPIGNMINEASIALSRQVDQLDAGALDVNCASGVLRFSVDGGGDAGFSKVSRVDVIPHARDQLLTKIIPHAYDPKATCPRFDDFLRRIMPEERMRRFLQRWFGLCMTALTGEQKLCYFYGTGANGKSVLVDLMAWLLSDYAAVAKIESLTGSNRRGGGDATPDLVQLVGARFVRASEPDEGVKWQEGLIKELTGGEPMLVRALQQDFFEFLPCFKLTISGNHKPDIRGTDEGIWRRLLLVPFDQHITKDERDPDLQKKLRQEAPGILRWAVEGLLDYLEGGLDEPEEVRVATAEFRAESDPIGQFLTDCTTVTGDPTDKIMAKDMIEAFNFWRARDGLGEWQPNTIAKRIKGEKAGKWRHPATGRSFEAHKASTTFYLGVRWTDMFGRDLRHAPRDQRGKIIGSPVDIGGYGDEGGM